MFRLMMPCLLLPASALAGTPVLQVMSWGGDFSAAQQTAFAAPFNAETGVKVAISDSDDPPTVVKTQAEARNVTLDLASVGEADAKRFCDEGIIEQIDPSGLAPAPDGTPATEDFLPGGLADCFVATDIYSTVVAYDTTKLTTPPSSAADFFDLERFPGRRGLGRTPEFTLELALLGDGVPAADVYRELATPEGVDRALAKLDSIRDQIVWWEAGAQAVQLLVDGEVAMTHAYNGRIFKSAVVDKRPLDILWDGQIYEIEGWVVPKGAPNRDEAMRFVTFSTTPEALARAAEQLPYGPPRKSSQSLVGKFAGDGVTQMAPHLPTDPSHTANALQMDPSFWADHEIELKERFAAWLSRA